MAAPKNYRQQLGWQSRESGDDLIFTGQYRVSGLRYDGWVRRDASRKLSFFIRNPPIEWLRDTEYGGCFHPRNDGWWLIGFKPNDTPADVSSGIAAIQKALGCAFEIRAQKRRTGRV